MQPRVLSHRPRLPKRLVRAVHRLLTFKPPRTTRLDRVFSATLQLTRMLDRRTVLEGERTVASSVVLFISSCFSVVSCSMSLLIASRLG